MFGSVRTSFVLALSLAATCTFAQSGASQDPSTYMHVNAPYAQSLVVKVKAAHVNDITKLGIHAVPPGETDNVIIANITPSKNGKKSSPADMQKLAMNKPIAVREEKNKIFDLLIPLKDAKGRDLNQGFVVMEVPFSRTTEESEALKIGVEVRDDLQRQIGSKEALYK